MTEELGLFPLGLVLVPTERIPLHIFEARYRELVRECLDDEREFGLVLDLGGDEPAEIGTRAAVVQLLQVLPDGRMNVVVEGRARFRIVARTAGRSFLTAEVEPVDDEDDPPEPEERERALASFARLVAATGSEVGVPEPAAEQLPFELAARIDFGNDLKQELLELRSPRERLARVTELIERAADAVERDRELRERAGRNGKVRPFGDSSSD
ncbi:MAG TPA: LON peptidase substrate-binding domain-containing protein [Gaiellaceae bacterium]|nr:LON peptidase substrate-binding domain-containing protein [Gaiellaceae bacterium]